MVQQLTTAQLAARKLMTVTPSKSYTAFFDSVLAAANYLDKSSSNGRRRIVVVISDGDDTAKILQVSAAQNRSDGMKLLGVDAQLQLIKKAQLDTLREVQRAEITFYSINPSCTTI